MCGLTFVKILRRGVEHFFLCVTFHGIIFVTGFSDPLIVFSAGLSETVIVEIGQTVKFNHVFSNEPGGYNPASGNVLSIFIWLFISTAMRELSKLDLIYDFTTVP